MAKKPEMIEPPVAETEPAAAETEAAPALALPLETALPVAEMEPAQPEPEAAPALAQPLETPSPVAPQPVAKTEPPPAETVAAPAWPTSPFENATHVVVYCNLPSGLSFRLPDGRKQTFKGYPVSNLVGMDGQALRSGTYGVTPNVRKEDWVWIAENYKGCAYFDRENPLLFAAISGSEGDVIAQELAETKSGLEQVDVNAPGATKTSPLKD